MNILMTGRKDRLHAGRFSQGGFMERKENTIVRSDRRRGVFCMVLASFLFAASGAAVKLITARLPSMEVVFFRFAMSVVILLPWMVFKGIPLRGNNRPVLLLRSLCGFIAGSLSFYVTSKIALADAYLLTYSSPVFVAVLSAIFFKDRIPFRLYALILLATAGCALVLGSGFDVVNLPGLLGVASALFSAFAYLGIKKLHGTDASATIVLHFSLFSAAAALVFGRYFLLPTRGEWLFLVVCGLCATLGQILMTLAYKYQDAAEVSPYSYATVLFSAMFGILFWREIPGLGTAAGGALLIVAGVGILKMPKKAEVDMRVETASLGKAVYD